MATKKQKREAALAKREEFLAKEKAAGLEAQERGKQHDAAEREVILAEIEEINARHRAILSRPENRARIAAVQESN